MPEKQYFTHIQAKRFLSKPYLRMIIKVCLTKKQIQYIITSMTVTGKSNAAVKQREFSVGVRKREFPCEIHP